MKKQEKSAAKNEGRLDSAGKGSGSSMTIQKVIVRSSSITRMAPKSTLKKNLSSKL